VVGPGVPITDRTHNVKSLEAPTGQISAPIYFQMSTWKTSRKGSRSHVEPEAGQGQIISHLCLANIWLRAWIIEGFTEVNAGDTNEGGQGSLCPKQDGWQALAKTLIDHLSFLKCAGRAEGLLR
jgi:hypothetical protein